MSHSAARSLVRTRVRRRTYARAPSAAQFPRVVSGPRICAPIRRAAILATSPWRPRCCAATGEVVLLTSLVTGPGRTFSSTGLEGRALARERVLLTGLVTGSGRSRGPTRLQGAPLTGDTREAPKSVGSSDRGSLEPGRGSVVSLSYSRPNRWPRRGCHRQLTPQIFLITYEGHPARSSQRFTSPGARDGGPTLAERVARRHGRRLDGPYVREERCTDISQRRGADRMKLGYARVCAS